ncbi:hypothetical protein QJS10_CPB22g00360 [Acorus calamus]|uniref:Uncharacterized protein n=1 Tax=Acorus calamus TaxID=4465 RepID=A0AAV9BZB5_ACOCL|nr:hypothetical protein QJS10_CPB22g00360 [Acorus calamus]
MLYHHPTTTSHLILLIDKRREREGVNVTMASTARVAVTAMRGGGPFEGLYMFVMRRNSVYVTFVVAGDSWANGYYLFREDDILGTLYD